MERQDTQEGLRVTLAEMEKVTWMQNPKSLNEQFLFCNLGSWAGQQKGRSAKQEGGKLCPCVLFPFVLVSSRPFFFYKMAFSLRRKGWWLRSMLWQCLT